MSILSEVVAVEMPAVWIFMGTHPATARFVLLSALDIRDMAWTSLAPVMKMIVR